MHAAQQSPQAVFLAGAVSGLVEGVSIQPLELLKTRSAMQHDCNTNHPQVVGQPFNEVMTSLTCQVSVFLFQVSDS
jgi:hypothetical protein